MHQLDICKMVYNHSHFVYCVWEQGCRECEKRNIQPSKNSTALDLFMRLTAEKVVRTARMLYTKYDKRMFLDLSDIVPMQMRRK